MDQTNNDLIVTTVRGMGGGWWGGGAWRGGGHGGGGDHPGVDSPADLSSVPCAQRALRRRPGKLGSSCFQVFFLVSFLDIFQHCFHVVFPCCYILCTP